MAITEITDEEHFDAEDFDREILAHGTEVLWRRARACPCIDPKTGHAEVDCPYCTDGILWDDGQSLIVLAPGRQRRDEYDVIGQWMQGMVMLTFPSWALPGHLDRIDMRTGLLVVDNERHTRGFTDRAGKSREILRLGAPVAIEWCGAIVDGELISYAVGQDFDMEGAVIRWRLDHGPPDGTQYTLRYVARPVYVVWSPQSRDEGRRKMPYRAMAQRLDFFRREAE